MLDSFSRVAFLFFWNIISYFYILLFKFSASALADGLSLEFEWQQVSSSLQDSSRYSGRSQQCSRLDGLYSPANVEVFQSL